MKKVEIIKYALELKPADKKTSSLRGFLRKKPFKLHRKNKSCHSNHILVCNWDLKRKLEFGSLSKKTPNVSMQ